MAIPAILGGIAIHGALHAGGEILSPFVREASYAANRIGPTGVPTLEALQTLWWSNRIGKNDFQRGLLNHGVSWRANGTDTDRWPQAWYQLIDLGRPMWSPEQYRTWMRQGLITEDEFRDMMARHGFTANSLFGDDECKNNKNYELFRDSYESYDFGLIIDLWRKGIITQQEKNEWLTTIGLNFPRAAQDTTALWVPPTAVEAGQIFNRKYIDEATYQLWLTRNGFHRDDVREQVAKMRFEVPGPSDLVRFAVRHVFEPDLIARFAFNDERNPILDFFHQTAGINYNIFSGPLAETIVKMYQEEQEVRDAVHDLAVRMKVPDPPGANAVPDWLDSLYVGLGLPKPTWAMAYWWSHWVWPSPTMGYRMFQRFRPTGGKNGGPRNDKGLVFDSESLDKLLRGNDYPPYYRPYLEALQYAVIPNSRIKSLYRHGVVDITEMGEMFQDTGYNPKDAERMADGAALEVYYERTHAEIANVKAATMQAYKTGTIDRDTTARYLYMVAIKNGKELRIYLQLDPALQLQLALAEPGIIASINAIDAAVAQQIAKASVVAVRKAYLRFEITQDQARLQLQQIGITPQRIEDYVTQWQYQFLGRGKTLAASQILRYVVRGAILPATAIVRLELLGYTTQDALTMVGVAQQDYDLAQAKAAVQAAKTAEQQSKGLTDAILAARKIVRMYQSDLARHGTPKQLAEWLAADLITQDEYDMRMGALGWPAADSQRLAAKAEGRKATRVFNEADLAAIQQGIDVPGI